MKEDNSRFGSCGDSWAFVKEIFLCSYVIKLLLHHMSSRTNGVADVPVDDDERRIGWGESEMHS